MQVDLERAKYVVREAMRLQPGRPALTLGLRAALAVIAPMVVALQIGPHVTTWATLGGFGVVLVDKSGAYRTRATAMAAATFGGALGVLLGSLSASSLAVLVVLSVGTGICAMAATWTGPAVAVGNIIAVHLIVATTLPHDPARPWVPALGFLAGGAWSMLLALGVWPVRVYRPARIATMTCIQAVARHIAEIAARDDANPDGWRDALVRRHRAIRETLETARAVLAATRRGRRGEIGRGERLLVIVESMDHMFGVLLGIEEVIDNLSAPARAAVGDQLRTGLAAAVAALDELAARSVIEHDMPPIAPTSWQAVPPRAAAAEAAPDLGPVARLEVTHALSLVTRIHDDIAAVAVVINSLADENEHKHERARTHDPDEDAAPDGPRSEDLAVPWNEALRSSLTLDSVVLRHALRIASIALLSVLVTRWLDLERGYWATLTAVLLLQPYLPATLMRGVQRVTGTIAGGLIAAAIVTLVQDPLGVSVISVVLAGSSAAVIQLNYGLYSLFLTPTFILLAEIHARDTHLVELRIVNTLLGAGLAVAGALLLWPVKETHRTADRLADALDAAADYLHEVFIAVATSAPAGAPPLIAARRRAGRAFNHADLSLDRMVAEGPPAAILEPHMTLATLTRRLAGTLSAFATARHVSDPRASNAIVTSIGADAEAYLRGAAAALRADTAPAPYPRHDTVTASLPGLLAARITRIDLQLSIIGEAAARTAPPRNS